MGERPGERGADNLRAGLTGKEPSPMRDVELKSYVFEEITPERMRRVDLLVEEGSVPEGARLPNNKHHVYRYHCPECTRITAVLARHVGHVPYIVDCAEPDCEGGAVQDEAAPSHLADHVLPEGFATGEIHATFFRPIEPGEVAAWVAGVEAEARGMVGDLGGDPDDADNFARQALQDAEATCLLNAHLVIEYR